MISVILYGRNDAHGYNLHRRAALSLNCLAEVLADRDDEIVFVDYNTADELPTFIEALSDTLTDRCLGLLRVFRVPAAIHEQRFAVHTHLHAIEPVARNVAARHANPSNRWLLSTNTDMIFLPLSAQRLGEICSPLSDAFYGLPRFELPEWLWEHLPRSDPSGAMAEIKRLGPGLRLDEPTASHEWIRFDAPGDFQLILREDFFAIDGFDEEMLLGWHVDSNLSRRMFIRRGVIESLEGDIAGYHCNHNRTPTIHHGAKWIANDMNRFYFSVARAELPAQRGTWGLADVALEEVQVRRRVGPYFGARVLEATQNGAASRLSFDAREAKFALTYDSGHVLPFVADSLAVSLADTTIGYIGANPILERMLAALVAGLELGSLLTAVELEDSRSIDELDRSADIIVVDLGVDASLLDASFSPGGGGESAQLRARLALSFDAFQRLVKLERSRLERGEHPRRFVLVNSSSAYWNAYVLAQLHCSPSTVHSRVRRATVKAVPDEGEVTRAAVVRALRLVNWNSRCDAGPRRLHLRLGKTVEIADLDDYGGFGEGWEYPDKSAIWTQGPRSELAIALDGSCEGDTLLALSFDKIGVSSESFKVALMVNDTRVAVGDFTRGNPSFTWRIRLPVEALADGKADLGLAIEDPVTWADDRRLGLHLRALSVRTSGWRGRLTSLFATRVTHHRLRR